jgi:hypothetical protein
MAEPKVNWDKLDVGIQHEGRAITLPGDPGNMPLEKAVEALQRKIADENQAFQIHEIIEGYPLDAAVAFVKAMAKLYGWASPVATPSFFGPRPPQMISVKTGPNDEDVIQCPLGGFRIPGVDQMIHTLIDRGPKGKLIFIVRAEIKKKDRHILLELANEARRFVREESIYKGKAIRLSVDDCGDIDFGNPPSFLAGLEDTTEASLIFDAEIQAQIDTSVLVPLKYPEECRKNKVPFKRGILLEGPYGTGKSLTARMVANVAQQNGVTFVLLDKVQGLQAGLEFAIQYSPAVVFAEDIDRVASERNEATNDLINIIDGVVSKTAKVMTILTTNFVEKLNPVILRPGRLDAVISLRAPTQDAVEKLLRMYAGKLLVSDTDIKAASKELAGQIPASIRECVERAKLGMIGREDTKLSDSDLVTAAKTMKNHLALLNKDNKKQSNAEKLAESLHAVVSNDHGNDEKLDGIEGLIRQNASLCDDMDDDVKRIKRSVC